MEGLSADALTFLFQTAFELIHFMVNEDGLQGQDIDRFGTTFRARFRDAIRALAQQRVCPVRVDETMVEQFLLRWFGAPSLDAVATLLRNIGDTSGDRSTWGLQLQQIGGCPVEDTVWNHLWPWFTTRGLGGNRSEEPMVAQQHEQMVRRVDQRLAEDAT